MDKYIECEAFLDAIERMKPYHQDADDIAEMLQNFPAADVVERRKGKWLQLGKCSECGGSAPFWSMASTYYESDFCPHCGADMREES